MLNPQFGPDPGDVGATDRSVGRRAAHASFQPAAASPQPFDDAREMEFVVIGRVRRQRLLLLVAQSIARTLQRSVDPTTGTRPC
jgi:hypothetical protein